MPRRLSANDFFTNLFCMNFRQAFFWTLIGMLFTFVGHHLHAESTPAYQIVVPNAPRELIYEEFRKQATKDCFDGWTREYDQAKCYHGIYNIWENIFTRLFSTTACDRHHRRKIAECPSKWRRMVSDVMRRKIGDYDSVLRIWYTTRGYTEGRLGKVCGGDWGFTTCIKDVMEWGPEELLVIARCMDKLAEIGKRSEECGDFVRAVMVAEHWRSKKEEKALTDGELFSDVEYEEEKLVVVAGHWKNKKWEKELTDGELFSMECKEEKL